MAKITIDDQRWFDSESVKLAIFHEKGSRYWSPEAEKTWADDTLKIKLKEFRGWQEDIRGQDARRIAEALEKEGVHVDWRMKSTGKLDDER
jgi:hypothetical protein